MYEFSKKQIGSFLTRAIQKQKIKDTSAEDYLKDLCDVVCILVEEGEIYRFSHRSFQTYFAACYTANVLTDEQQKKLFQTDYFVLFQSSKIIPLPDGVQFYHRQQG